MTRAMPTPAWMALGSCAQADPEAWFPETGDASTRHALRVCAACPVRVECLEYALDQGMTDGIWGGTRPGERRRIAARRRKGSAA